MKTKMPNGKIICAVNVGDKGQIVIPKKVRDMFDINPGDTLLMLGDINKGIALVGADSIPALDLPVLADDPQDTDSEGEDKE